MRFSVLGSGSSGNATLVSSGPTHVLVDAGLSGRQLARRLSGAGVAPGDVAAILVTHEHGDHARGAGVFARAYDTPLLMTAGTLRGCRKLLRGTEDARVYRPGYPVVIGRLVAEPFATVHDAAEPVAVVLADHGTGLRLGIATDLGRPTAQVKHALRDCDGLVVESNHDEAMLWEAGYPASVKSRIASSHGHLSNQAAANLVLEVLSPRLTAVVLAHLSDESNTVDRARSVMTTALAKKGYRGLVEVADPGRSTRVFDLATLRRTSGPRQPTLF